jgi:Flp pilus assembly protein TadD
VSHEFHQRLKSARAEQAEHLADELQGRHGLTVGERERLIGEAAPLIAALPRQVTPEIERSVESELRDLYRDLRLDPNEAARLRAFRVQQRLTEADVTQIETTLLDRLKPAAEHLRRARTLVDRRMFAEAEQEYRRATEIDPSDPLAWAQLGAVLAVLHRAEEAFTSYQRALELDPLNWLAHYNLAVWYARRKDTGEALSHVESALASVPPGQRAERQSVIQALLEEPDLATLRRDPRFVDLVASTPAADHGASR